MNHSNLLEKRGSAVRPRRSASQATTTSGRFTVVDGEDFFCISNCQDMPGFFMSLSTSGNHWMFVSSEGAVAAGRENPQGAFFPYYSADKLSDMQHCAGPRTIVRVSQNSGKAKIWEPFLRGHSEFAFSRNIYKNTNGNKLIFEEINHDLKLVFLYRWTFSWRFGIVRTCRLINLAKTTQNLSVLDGFENILPACMDDLFQLKFSNLGDAYKKNELLSDSKLGIFYLSSIPSDRAEPSEGLSANVAWHSGVKAKSILVSSQQVERFRKTGVVSSETDVRGKRGAYLIHHVARLNPQEVSSWEIVGDVGLETTDVHNLKYLLEESSDVGALLRQDIESTASKLDEVLASADGCQAGAEPVVTARHKSNVLFNIMRGGIPANNYLIDPEQFIQHLNRLNQPLAQQYADLFSDKADNAAGRMIEIWELHQKVEETGDADLIRIAHEYLPLTFSRCHGDPTRPWNRFSIQAFSGDKASTIDYQGNWRDIFQNWEALSLSYPQFSSGMVFRFLNASTADGHNPYRLKMSGFEWETPEPDDPWSNIGYWGDHQIVYLQKLLHWCRKFDPESFDRWFNRKVFSYAEIPYRIRSYTEISDNPKETIDYDLEQQKRIEARVSQMGADGKLLRDSNGDMVRVTMAEKLLLPALTKMTNFVPDGGIWLNTQRPEWNDANNALVGYGMSVVTVCHLRRFFAFLKDWLDGNACLEFEISSEVAELFNRVDKVLEQYRNSISDLDSQQRKVIVDTLSQAGSDYRAQLYGPGLSGDFVTVESAAFVQFAERCLVFIDQTIQQNLRSDGLYHSYNLLRPTDDGLEIEPLFEMLEGQVAVLSSGLLSAEQALGVLGNLRNSAMYREDQCSYMLYPDRELERFTDKNSVDRKLLEKSELARKLIESERGILRADVKGELHFTGFRNVSELDAALDRLAGEACFESLVKSERSMISAEFERTFNHRQFIGRSNTFFGYEGLGSIYWHMVSKLCLAAQECLTDAIESGAAPGVIQGLRASYQEIRDVIAKSKTPQNYGAFPSDPYSHTPAGGGAQQPGMTGQVKEDIIVRLCELGVRIQDGCFSIDPSLLEKEELLSQASTFEFFSLAGQRETIELPANTLAFTFCQVPIVLHLTEDDSVSQKVQMFHNDQSVKEQNGLALNSDQSRSLFLRNNEFARIEFFISRSLTVLQT